MVLMFRARMTSRRILERHTGRTSGCGIRCQYPNLELWVPSMGPIAITVSRYRLCNSLGSLKLKIRKSCPAPVRVLSRHGSFMSPIGVTCISLGICQKHHHNQREQRYWRRQKCRPSLYEPTSPLINKCIHNVLLH